MELARILDRAYEFSRNRFATEFEELAATKETYLKPPMTRSGRLTATVGAARTLPNR